MFRCLITSDEMLLWSESAPDSVADPMLAERLAAEISDADYESKIRSDCWNALSMRDVAADPGCENTSGALRYPPCAVAITTS